MALPVLVIACGAIARELAQLRDLNGWDHVQLQCLDAKLHNTPDRIPGLVEAKIKLAQGKYAKIFVAYGDCGTGGKLDEVLEQYGVARLPAAHCYEFLTGSEEFSRLSEAEPTSYYLTDFLLRHFQRLVIEGLGLDRYPELLPQYFGNYRRLLYLAQTDNPEKQDQARAYASYLGLEYHFIHRGLGPLERALKPAVARPES